MSPNQKTLAKLVQEWTSLRALQVKYLSVLNEKMAELRAKHAVKIRPTQARIDRLHERIIIQLDGMRHEFSGAKSMDICGAKVGFRKSPDLLVFVGNSDAVELIKEVLGADSNLLRTEQYPILAKVKELSAEVMAKVGFKIVQGCESSFAGMKDALEDLAKKTGVNHG